jgi:hypothetical protein
VRAAIEAVHSLEVNLRIVEPTYSADGVWRVDVFIAGKRVFTEAFDGRHGWQLRSREPGTTSSC